MELWIMLEKMVLCLHHHLPRRAIYCLRAASREAATAVMSQHPGNSPGAESSSPSRVKTRLEISLLLLLWIKNYCSHLPLPQHRFPTGWADSIQLKHMFNNKNIPCQLFKQNALWMCLCGSWLGADKPGAGLRAQGPIAESLWHWLGHSHSFLCTILTQSQAQHRGASPKPGSSCCWEQLAWNPTHVQFNQDPSFLGVLRIRLRSHGNKASDLLQFLAEWCNFSAIWFPQL